MMNCCKFDSLPTAVVFLLIIHDSSISSALSITVRSFYPLSADKLVHQVDWKVENEIACDGQLFSAPKNSPVVVMVDLPKKLNGVNVLR